MREQTGVRASDWIVLLALLLIGALLGADRGLVSGPVSRGVRAVLVPPQSAVNTACVATGDFFSGVFGAPARSREMKALRAKAASAEALEARLREVERENERLKSLFETLQEQPRDPIPVRVIAHYPLTMTATLSAGSRQGVQIGDPVVSPRGLAGVVEVVDTSTCRMLFNTSTRFSAGARVSRDDSRASGIVRGGGGELLLFDHLPEGADVQPGDEVITSGVGRIYPKGLLIGTVTRVWRDPSYAFLRAWVRPSVRHDVLEEAVILR
jgi:rod shape-determining protein MreC